MREVRQTKTITEIYAVNWEAEALHIVFLLCNMNQAISTFRGNSLSEKFRGTMG